MRKRNEDNRPNSIDFDQWDNYIPPLNLLNYNLYWRWLEEWQYDDQKDLTSNDKDS